MTNKLSRRQFLAAAGSVAGAAALAACVPVAETAAPANNAAAEGVAVTSDGLVEIEYWHRQSGDTALLLETLAGEFNAAHEGEVSVLPIAQGSIQELNQKVRAAAAGGGMPGALMGDDYDITQYAFSNILQDLDPYIADTTYGLTQEQIDDILPEQYNRHKLEIYDNARYSFPIAFSAFATFWNEDLLANAGLEKPPASWDEFPEYGRTASAANGDIPVWLISGAGDRFISCLLTYGVEWAKPGGEESNFDAPEALEIMTWWRELSDEGLLTVSKEARDLYVAQQNLHYMDSSANANRFHNTVTDFAWNGGLPPQRHEGTPVTETYGPVNTIPKTSPEQQLAGWRWLKFLIEPDVHARYVAQTSYFPSTKSAIDTELLQGIYNENPIARRMIDDVSVYARILAPSPALPEIRGVITANVVEEVMLQQLSPEEGVRKLKAEADAAIRNATM
ncbi:MAG TPA: extracellular solute-binding protein [Caldilineaceae bacterium]|nr:extracellular solute-binding protein [Caldilineaceae bacterium]